MSGGLSTGDRAFRRPGAQCLMLVQYALRTYTNTIRERTANVNPELPDTAHDDLVSVTGEGSVLANCLSVCRVSFPLILSLSA